MGELAAQSSRQLGPPDGRLAYDAAVAGRAGPQQPNGPHKPKAKGLDHCEPAASSEAVTRRMSLGDMLGPLFGMPDGNFKRRSGHSVAPVGQRQNETPIYDPGVTVTRGF